MGKGKVGDSKGQRTPPPPSLSLSSVEALDIGFSETVTMKLIKLPH